MKQKRNLKDETDLKNLTTKQSCHLVRCPCYNNGATLRSCFTRVKINFERADGSAFRSHGTHGIAHVIER